MEDVQELGKRYWELSRQIKDFEIHSREFIVNLRVLSHLRERLDSLCDHDWRYAVVNHAICLHCGLDKP